VSASESDIGQVQAVEDKDPDTMVTRPVDLELGLSIREDPHAGALLHVSFGDIPKPRRAKFVGDNSEDDSNSLVTQPVCPDGDAGEEDSLISQPADLEHLSELASDVQTTTEGSDLLVMRSGHAGSENESTVNELLHLSIEDEEPFQRVGRSPNRKPITEEEEAKEEISEPDKLPSSAGKSSFRFEGTPKAEPANPSVTNTVFQGGDITELRPLVSKPDCPDNVLPSDLLDTALDLFAEDDDISQGIVRPSRPVHVGDAVADGCAKVPSLRDPVPNSPDSDYKIESTVELDSAIDDLRKETLSISDGEEDESRLIPRPDWFALFGDEEVEPAPSGQEDQLNTVVTLPPDSPSRPAGQPLHVSFLPEFTAQKPKASSLAKSYLEASCNPNQLDYQELTSREEKVMCSVLDKSDTLGGSEICQLVANALRVTPSHPSVRRICTNISLFLGRDSDGGMIDGSEPSAYGDGSKADQGQGSDDDVDF
jgi:hypothetical protein